MRVMEGNGMDLVNGYEVSNSVEEEEEEVVVVVVGGGDDSLERE